MNPQITSQVMELPGPQRFLQKLRDAIAAGRSLVVLLPDGIEPEDIWEALRAKIASLDPQCVPLQELNAHKPLAEALGEYLEVEWMPPNAPRAAASLLTARYLPQVVVLTGFADLERARREDWLPFLMQWAQAAKGIADRDDLSAALLLPVRACDLPAPINSDVFLSVVAWWGVVSALDVRLLCRWNSREPEGTFGAQWQEQTAASLAGGDPSLAAWLLESVDCCLDAVLARLCAYAAERGWTPTLLRRWGADKVGPYVDSSRLFPPSDKNALWEQGILAWTPEYGLELNSAALALLEQREQVRHRLWRGHTAALFPLLDAVRLTVCEYLTRRHGEEWPLCPHGRGQFPGGDLGLTQETEALRRSPLNCELSLLKSLLSGCEDLLCEQHLLPLVLRTHWVRNELAHYRLVGREEFEWIVAEFGKQRSRLTYGG